MRIHGYPTGALGLIVGLIVGIVFLCGAIGAVAARLWRRKWWIGGLAGVVLGVVLITTLALAHDPYSGWTLPDTGHSCCNKQDCRPVRSYLGDDGVHYIWHEARWRPVPATRILRVPSPDGGSHACINDETLEILCFVPGQPQG